MKTGEKDTRNLVFRFWNLTISQRREITHRLGLIEESEMSLPEPERYGRALLRASERGLLDKLAREIRQEAYETSQTTTGVNTTQKPYARATRGLIEAINTNRENNHHV